ncbi:MAG: DNA helicase [Saprospiraceae bacterium]|nr:MAG: DNA helicase [Saprospiraceae bacterium]
MNTEGLARLFYQELLKIEQNAALEKAGKVEALYRLLNLLFVEMTRKEKLQFATLFSRIAYVSHKYQLSRPLQFYLHRFRWKASLSLGEETDDNELYGFGFKVLTVCIEALLKEGPPPEVLNCCPPAWPFPFRRAGIKKFLPHAKVLLVGEDQEQSWFLAKDESRAEENIRIQYNIPERNEHFNPTVRVIRQIFGFPLMLTLLDVEVDDEGIYKPRAFIVEPDYLVDVSAISECFSANGADPWPYLLKKFLPFTTSVPLMVGNIANFFLDELMSNPDVTFGELKKRIFQLNPLAFCQFDDRQIRDVVGRSQLHFVNLKQMVKEGFARENIKREDSFLEPAFYSAIYGLQGRLDFLYRDTEAGKGAIVELKSGKPFMANIHGLGPNHFMQTLLYDLLVKSTYDKELEAAAYILYSGLEERQLRFAPATKSQQYDGLQLRNQLLGMERMLTKLGTEEGTLIEQGQPLFGRLDLKFFPKLRGFSRDDMNLFQQLYQSLQDVEKAYLIAFSGFIAREHQLAKTGEQGVDRINGLASLWLNSRPEKQANYDLMSSLTMVKNQAAEEEPLIWFARHQDDKLANFRQGDIAILYPDSERGPLASQLFKCTLVELTPDQVCIRLRSRQFNSRAFDDHEFWNLEHDLLDSSFVSMYRNLFAFAQASKGKRALLLTQREPKIGPAPILPPNPKMTEEQSAILQKVLTTEDYFLLWGPPGTGKTSVMLRHLVAHLLTNTEDHMLLLAYTNRAVDEICAAIERIGGDIKNQYLRIGSRYSTGEAYHTQLLSLKARTITSRKELKELIQEKRIIVATVSSIAGKPELQQLKTFHWAIIDEASQILEPMLVGMLPHFKRFVLIGDHRQLPAVVVQDASLSSIKDPILYPLGLRDLRNSLFERLYQRCQEENWHWAYAQLSHQGRMHREIMDFPNRYFYNGELKILPESVQDRIRQTMASPFQIQQEDPDLDRQLCERRTLFFNTPIDESSRTAKTNQYEAERIGQLVACYQNLYRKNGRPLGPESIGIITPYRAQIATIRAVLENAELDHQSVTIDTVERYQGGAREVILISLCTNSSRQMQTLSSLSLDGVDRKLNVALTRARDHLVIVGNEVLLRTNPVYRDLVDYLQQKG